MNFARLRLAARGALRRLRSALVDFARLRLAARAALPLAVRLGGLRSPSARCARGFAALARLAKGVRAEG
jgi:hypothetical protein